MPTEVKLFGILGIGGIIGAAVQYEYLSGYTLFGWSLFGWLLTIPSVLLLIAIILLYVQTHRVQGQPMRRRNADWKGDLRPLPGERSPLITDERR